MRDLTAAGTAPETLRQHMSRAEPMETCRPNHRAAPALMCKLKMAISLNYLAYLQDAVSPLIVIETRTQEIAQREQLQMKARGAGMHYGVGFLWHYCRIAFQSCFRRRQKQGTGKYGQQRSAKLYLD